MKRKKNVRGSSVKRLLGAYFACVICIICALALVFGIMTAGGNTRRMRFGNQAVTADASAAQSLGEKKIRIYLDTEKLRHNKLLETAAAAAPGLLNAPVSNLVYGILETQKLLEQTPAEP